MSDTTKILAEFGTRYLTKGIDSVLDAANLQRRPSTGNRALTALGFFGLGVGAGVAGYALSRMFAPQIAEGAKQVKKVAAETMPQVAHAVGIDNAAASPNGKTEHTDEPAIRRRENRNTPS